MAVSNSSTGEAEWAKLVPTQTPAHTDNVSFCDFSQMRKKKFGKIYCDTSLEVQNGNASEVKNFM